MWQVLPAVRADGQRGADLQRAVCQVCVRPARHHPRSRYAIISSGSSNIQIYQYNT